MGKIESAFRAEVARLARKEIRSLCGPMTHDVRRLRRTVARLGRTVASMERIAKRWADEMQARKADLKVPEQEVESARLSPGLIRKLRKRLGLSQAQLGTLVGVSTLSVGLWENGKTSPRGANRTALVALRKLGKRDVRKILDQKAAPKPKKRGRKPKGKPAKKAGRKKK